MHDGVQAVEVRDGRREVGDLVQVGDADVGAGVPVLDVGGASLVAGEQDQFVAAGVQDVRDGLSDAGAGAGDQHPHLVRTTLPKTSPAAIASKP